MGMTLLGRNASLTLITIGALLASACGPGAAGSPPPNSTNAAIATPTTVPTRAPTASESPAPTAPLPTEVLIPSLQPNIVVRVDVPILNVRELPTTAATVVGSLERNDIAVLRDFKTRSDGYVWYVAIQGVGREPPPLPDSPLSPVDSLAGWIAVDDGSTLYVEVLPARCPAVIDIGNVGAMLAGEQLTCFGSRSLSIEGTYGCLDCGGAPLGLFEPDWLARPLPAGYLSVTPFQQLRQLVPYFPPDVAMPAAGSIVRIRGHFDDPRASTCAISLDETGPVATEEATIYCRQRFVVESYDVLGVDPQFPAR